MTTQKIGDIDMYFEITGEGEPILFLHGLGSSVRDWESQIGPDHRLLPQHGSRAAGYADH